MKKSGAKCKCGKPAISRGMCRKCYGHEYRKGTYSGGNPYKKGTTRNPSTTGLLRAEHASEIRFIKNYFTHKDYIYQPAMFHLGDAGRYTPDFYDPNTGAFIEVVGTRQAFHANKHKYAAFARAFPTLVLKVLDVCGGPLDGTKLPETT
jgi:hypothetical protein